MSKKNVKVHLPFGRVSAIGPGKADLLEAIERAGSISAAARQMGMSYKRAWDLVDTMNKSFCEPLVLTAAGGSGGGGARVTAFGQDILSRYRAIEKKANAAVADDLETLTKLLAD